MNFEHETKLKVDPEFSGLYAWALNETGGKDASQDLIPWPWTIFFEGTSCTVSAGLAFDAKPYQQPEEPPAPKLAPRESIKVELSSETSFSMFGTTRRLKSIELHIVSITGPEQEAGCTAWGCPSYTTENDFRDVTTDDCLIFTVLVEPGVFRRYQNMILMGFVERVTFHASGLDGIYSEWSPGISTDRVKVLTADSEHVVDLTANPEFKPPRLGAVRAANFQFHRSLKLAHGG